LYALFTSHIIIFRNNGQPNADVPILSRHYDKSCYYMLSWYASVLLASTASALGGSTSAPYWNTSSWMSKTVSLNRYGLSR